MLSAAQLAAMQAIATRSLDVSGVQVQRKTGTTDDGMGHQTPVWSTIATVAGGLARPSAPIMTQYAGVIGSIGSWVVSLPLGTDIRRDDQLVIPSTGLTLRVQADLTQSSYSTLTQVLATEIR